MIKNNFSLKAYNSFGIDVTAKRFAAFKIEDELDYLLSDIENKEPLLILGGGSNILFTKDFEGTVLKNELSGIEKINEDADHVYLKAGAGENWHGFVEYCLMHNYAGIENLALIPGSVGASPMQNIGAYGVEIKDVFHELEAWHIKDRSRVVFSKEDCAFGYRDSVFKNKYKDHFVLTSVTYRLNKKPSFHTGYGAIREQLDNMQVKDLTIQSIAQAVMHIRRSKLPDPEVIGNAGSFFKNPEVPGYIYMALQARFPGIVGYILENKNVKLAAGWMIEQCGWKGYREGDAGCHAKQSLVLVNYGNATGSQIFSLSEKIIISVREKFGVILEREVNTV